MSGGVDSSVAALLLKEQGYEVIGITLKVWLGDCSDTGEHACCGPRAVEDGRSVAYQLGIPFYVIDHKEAFQENVIDYFCNEYREGRTPNPCVVCNRKLKFGSMLEFAEKLGAWKLATGHYANVEEKKGEFILRKGKDLKKDQSYFLYTLTQGKLSKLYFPLGNRTKSESRELAKKAGLKVFDKSDSQEICFVPDGKYVNFLKKAVPGEFQKGPMKDMAGNMIGTHEGIQNFTIGQRKGLGIAFGHPAYVVALDGKTNTVIVGEEKDLYVSGFRTKDTHWISNQKPKDLVECTVKIRSMHEGARVTVSFLDESHAQVQLLSPEKAVTPGQAAVFYDGDQVLGGGFIE
ncbi:MAG: tRNA 2-thiouridine(34) synthase MnmA [Chlamydiae bacterium]|nr:tRNA 2-thiouridine(34) synthase MnmA [Chlamydiota bacterium]MBI3266911.1 tRNA 2-thiouridine(34) synthase MnmA [Chlamydiota bacterium]